MGVRVKLAFHMVALVVLCTVTMLMVHEAPTILEEVEVGGLPYKEVVPSGDELFDKLTAVDTPSKAGDSSTITAIADPLGVNSLLEVPPGSVCLERATPECKSVPTSCTKQGPSCTYEKMCLAKDESTCVPSGICTQPVKKCHDTFSKECIACAQTTPDCKDAHDVATNCVGKCEITCMKDAVCEQNCARGCLSKYKALASTCKKQCKPCEAGSKKVCWDGCNQWKTCAKKKKVCQTVDECVDKGKKCTFEKRCHKYKKQCEKVSQCVESEEQCKTETVCSRRDTKCTYGDSDACVACKTGGNHTSCNEMTAVQQRCSGDCAIQCQGEASQSACMDKCNAGCKASEDVLFKACKSDCPECERTSNTCHLACLEEETKHTCRKVCKRQEMVDQCEDVCEDERNEKHCVGVCNRWQPKKSCTAPCQQWAFSAERPCDHPCKQHGFRHSCDDNTPTCVQWTGGRKCDKDGACLKWEVMPPVGQSNSTTDPTLPLAPGPVIPTDPGFDKSFEDAYSAASANSSTTLQADLMATQDSTLGAGAISPTPLSPDSKMGKVLHDATEDVERMLRGLPPQKHRPQATAKHGGSDKAGAAPTSSSSTREQRSPPEGVDVTTVQWDPMQALSLNEPHIDAPPPLAVASQPRLEQEAFAAVAAPKSKAAGAVLVESRATAAVPVPKSSSPLTDVEAALHNAQEVLSTLPAPERRQLGPQQVVPEDPRRLSEKHAKAAAVASAAAAEWREAQMQEMQFSQTLHR